MKTCPICCTGRLDDRWHCANCGARPDWTNGFLSFAPRTEGSDGGFRPDLFEALAEVEARSFWFQARNELIVWALNRYGVGARSFLEIGCGMGFHTETMVRAGARVTAVDLSPTSVAATRRRLELKGLQAEVIEGDAEHLPFEDRSFDFVWSWGVIHHSSRTGRVVRNIARVLRPEGECRVMVYNRQSTWAMSILVRDYLLRGQFLRKSFEETLYESSDGFTARFYPPEQFEDLFRTFFDNVTSVIMGQESDVLPLPHKMRDIAIRLLPRSYQERAQSRRGSFIFLTASRPI